ncbi:hypothetical protein [Psychrobacter sp. NPDC078631]|uniref:hypothetical protein n=1 Tax=Psychrobacter sp. NPDC078631 TaxID=3390666 RepID=UPI003CFE76A6
MRKFGKEEQSILKKLVETDVLRNEGMVLLDVFLEKNFFSNEYSKSILVDPNARKAQLSMSSSDKDECRKEIIEVTRLVNLLIDIEKLGLVSFIGDENQVKNAIGYQYPKGITIDLVSPLSIFLYTKIGNFILPSEGLIELVDNDFMSTEEIRHNETMYWTRFAIFIAIVIGVIGIFT